MACELYLSVSEGSIDNSANTSVVTWSLTVYNNSGYHIYNNYTTGSSAPTYSVTLDGQTWSGNFTYDVAGYGTVWVAGGSKTVTHNNDGSKTITFSGSCNGRNSAYGFGSLTTGGSKTLTTISRASTLSVSSSSVAIGGVQSITITKNISSYKSTLTYSCSGATGTLLSNSDATSYSWTIPASIASSITSSTSATCTLTLTSYDGSTVIGTDTKTFTVTIPNTNAYKPSIVFGNLTITNGFSNNLIGGRSSFTQEYTITQSSGASLKSRTVTFTNNVSVASSTNSSATSGIVPASSSQYSVSISVTVTDSRGRSTTATTTIGTVYPYSPPVITITNLYRCDNQGAADPAGTYAYISVNISSSTNVTTKNVVVNNVTYQLVDAVGSYFKIIGDGNLNATNQYTVVVSVSNEQLDSYGVDPISVTGTISTMNLPISLYDDGTNYGVTLGRIANEPGFHIYMSHNLLQYFNITTENTDLNDYTTTGIYYFSGSYTPTNIPTGVNGWLLVLSGDSVYYVKQIWFRHGTANSNDYQTFVRSKIAGAWSSWRMFVTEAVS